MAVVSGALLAVSYTNSAGTDLRPGRYTDLASLVRDEAQQYDELRAEVADVTAEVDRLAASVDDREVERAQRRAAALEGPAGLRPRSGQGVVVTLSDAPADLIEQAIATSTIDPNLLVVHQQDIQAVVNAMWVGDAAAITIQGQRVITTTGIKCEGNAVQLQGRPYPQPYQIAAVGDPARLLAAIDEDPTISAYRADAEDPDIAVGWEVDVEPVVAPAYDGVLALSYAEPLR